MISNASLSNRPRYWKKSINIFETHVNVQFSLQGLYQVSGNPLGPILELEGDLGIGEGVLDIGGNRIIFLNGTILDIPINVGVGGKRNPWKYEGELKFQ